MLTLAVLCAAAMGAAAPDEPATKEVLFEREVPPAWLQRYELSGGGNLQPVGTTREEILKKLEKHKVIAKMVRIELEVDRATGRFVYTTRVLGEDRIYAAENEKWRKHAFDNLASGLKNPERHEGFQFVGRAANFSDAPIFFEDPPEAMSLGERFRGPGGETASVEVFNGIGRPIGLHQLLRPLIRGECSVIKAKAGYVVKSKGRPTGGAEQNTMYRLAWLSGDGLLIYATALEVDPEPLIDLWAEKFPSSLPADFKIDKLAWGRDEFEYWLGRMKKAAEAPPGIDYWVGRGNSFPGDAFYCDGEVRAIPWYVSNCQQTIVFPHLDGGLPQGVSSDRLREQYRLLADWWPKVKDKTYWDEPHQMLVAPGYTPEELLAAAQDRERKRAEAVLSEPITEEKKTRIVAEAVPAFETYLKERTNEWKEYGGRHEKVNESSWRLWGTMRDGRLIEETYAGPTIEESAGDRRYVYRAVFSWHISDKAKGVERDKKVVFRYDKLEGKWVKE